VATEVPHARDAAVPTFAWRLATASHRLVYASDLASPTDGLEQFARGARLLVIDGATYGRRIYSHLRIDEDLPEVCRWDVERILLTQIGRSAPSHEELRRRVAQLCPRARPAHDGLAVAF
jgi:ribonuclease BN (tRNA processing enzyme)